MLTPLRFEATHPYHAKYSLTNHSNANNPINNNNNNMVDDDDDDIDNYDDDNIADDDDNGMGKKIS